MASKKTLEFETVEDALRFAIAKEQEANRFYRAMAERVQSEHIAGMLLELAAEELEHKEKLELEMMKNGRVVDTEWKDEGFRVGDYVISEVPELDLDLRDMLCLAIAKEDAAFTIYVNLFAKARNEGAKQALLAIAQQEARHKLRFEIEYDNLLKKQQEP
ncbi:MAG: ferritin-like domain-containing protein [Phycisphaerales bacterium]|nr:MAG: ferritin-like domain-containing protein [Phycisphaerales bacterium]